MYEEKNKRKVHYDRIDPEVFSDLEKDYKKYKITPETIENAKRMATLIGDSFIVRIDRDSYLRALLGYAAYKELNSPMERIMLRPQCEDESAVKDITKFSIDIHRDGVDKNLRGMTVTHMYVDDFYNLPEPPSTTVIEVIQTTDYERLSRLTDYYSYSHHLMDAFILDAMIQEKEERNNDSLIGKVSYRCSIPCNYGMHDTNHTENVSALRRRLRHR